MQHNAKYNTDGSINGNASNGYTQPFFFPGGESGVLLVHGYLTSPGEMRPLGEYLTSKGMTVMGICLEGHGTQPEDLAGVSWQDWVSNVRTGVKKLREHCVSVSIAGHSLGAALALYTAAHEPLKRVVAFSAPDGTLVPQTPIALAKPLSQLIQSIPKIGSDMRDPIARRHHFTYQQIPLESAVQLATFLGELDTALPKVTSPTLLVHARKDRVVPLRVARRVARQLGGPVYTRILDRGGHTVVLDYDWRIAFAATWIWLKDGVPS